MMAPTPRPLAPKEIKDTLGRHKSNMAFRYWLTTKATQEEKAHESLNSLHAPIHATPINNPTHTHRMHNKRRDPHTTYCGNIETLVIQTSL
jgi:hypothetical protein